MRNRARLPDWSSLDEHERPVAARECRERLADVGRRLHAVAGLCAPDVQRGMLGGMPYVAKDMIATGEGDPSCGCRESPFKNAAVAPLIAHLARAGAALIGRAEMTELAYEPSGINASRDAVLNPWNFGYAPGGSSSGSAALVAAGCCFAALGSDTGGSVRIPAHCCGVSGLKPTWGRIATERIMSLAPSLDTIGLLARSAVDIAAIWAVLFDEPISRRSDSISAVVLADALADSDAEIAEICDEAIGVLRGLGLRVGKVAGFPEKADENCLLVMQAEAARTHRARLGDERIDPMLRKRLSKGLAISDDDLATALAQRARLQSAFLAELVGGADVVLLPVMPVMTPRLAEVDPASPQFAARKLYALSRFTRFANYLDLPVLAVPIGFDSRGMPVGLQIVGRPGCEELLLGIGMVFQAATDWHSRIPTAIAGNIAAEKGLVA